MPTTKVSIKFFEMTALFFFFFSFSHDDSRYPLDTLGVPWGKKKMQSQKISWSLHQVKPMD